MKFRGINHAALATNDMDRTILYWRDLLGMRLIAGTGDNSARQYFFEIAENSMISFFEWPDVEPVEDRDAGRPVKGPFSLDHICFELEDAGALWELKARLESSGLWVSEVMDNGFIDSFFSTDPNNIQIEFCYRKKDIDLSKTPAMIDPRKSALAAEGPEPCPGKWPAGTKHTTMPGERHIYPGALKALGHQA